MEVRQKIVHNSKDEPRLHKKPCLTRRGPNEPGMLDVRSALESAYDRRPDG